MPARPCPTGTRRIEVNLPEDLWGLIERQKAHAGVPACRQIARALKLWFYGPINPAENVRIDASGRPLRVWDLHRFAPFWSPRWLLDLVTGGLRAPVLQADHRAGIGHVDSTGPLEIPWRLYYCLDDEGPRAGADRIPSERTAGAARPTRDLKRC